jgi:ABC-2 type transport system ATP-binding protein
MTSVFAIRTEGLSKIYKTPWGKKETSAVKMLNLEVRQGEVFGLLGPNGAGKTSTIHLLLNLIRPTTGVAFLFDRPVTDTEVHRRLGYLPESVNLHTYYRGRALLNFYAALCGVPVELREGRVTAVLKLLNLEDAADKQVAKYSKGMAQRIGVAQALLHDPDLLILDEPTASLDPVGRNQFRELLLELKRCGKTILISSHILSEVESVCDRVAILESGALKRMGTLRELSAGGSTRLVVDAIPGPVMQMLASTSAEVTWVQGQMTIRCPNDDVRHTVSTLLREHNVEILRQESEAQSLDEIFLSTIKQEPAS